jgi:formylglycine-generating enzyme required for sulfatase activity
MARIFISYRRADSRLVTNRIYDRLVQALGKKNVFKDVDNIPPGRDFRGVLREATANCEIMLVVIGPQWLDIRDSAGNRRLDDPNDFVRLEVETGLQRDGILVIPLLIEKAVMPSAQDLPDSLRELAYNNAFAVGDDPYFHRDMDTLISYLRQSLPGSGGRAINPRLLIGAAAAAVVLLVIAGAVLLRPGAGAAITPTSIAQPDTPLPVTDTPTVTETPTPEPPTATDPPAVTPTLSSFAQLQTVAVGLTRAVETEIARYQTATAEALLGLTETAASEIILALSATSTYTPTPTATPTPLQVAFTPVAHNPDWTPIERDFDGVTMVLVPAGCFMMGSSEGDSDEQPVHEQCFDEPFWIDKYEVTQAQFRRLGGRRVGGNQFDGEDRPVDSIGWYEARDFCALRGGRLPTEAEWEYAARGPESWVYPWGNMWYGYNAVWNRRSSEGTINVGNIPGSVSWVGALDMSGNVWEWTSSKYKSYPYDAADGREAEPRGTTTEILREERVLRGGSWNDDNAGVLRASSRDGFVILVALFNPIGFRCTHSYQ